MQHLTPKHRKKSQKDTDRIWLCSHNCNLRGGNPHCWKFSEYQFAVCTVDSSSLVWAGQEKIQLKSRAKYTGALSSSGLPKCSHHTSANNSKIISVECFPLNNCYSYLHWSPSVFYIPQKCFDLLFVRPLDKYIIHQHNHPIIIQLQRSPCQLVLCVNAPSQKNRFPVFCGFPHYLLNHQTIQIMEWGEPWHLALKVIGYSARKVMNFTKVDTHNCTSSPPFYTDSLSCFFSLLGAHLICQTAESYQVLFLWTIKQQKPKTKLSPF